MPGYRLKLRKLTPAAMSFTKKVLLKSLGFTELGQVLNMVTEIIGLSSQTLKPTKCTGEAEECVCVQHTSHPVHHWYKVSFRSAYSENRFLFLAWRKLPQALDSYSSFMQPCFSIWCLSESSRTEKSLPISSLLSSDHFLLL